MLNISNKYQEFRIRNVHCETTTDNLNDTNRIYYKNLPNDCKVPVIRMYGILDNGEKCLANIHYVFPYFYLKTREPFNESVKKYIENLILKCAQLLDYKFIQKCPLIADIIPCELKDMYGFYENDDHFVKILFYDPKLCYNIGLTLQKECGKHELLQPYFTHIPYLLQFFIDYNIFGMGIMRAKIVNFRSYTLKTEKLFKNISISNVLPTSIMDVEVDIIEKDIILERSPSMQSEYQCSGLEFIWNEERLRCSLRNATLNLPERPEIGVPVNIKEREKDHFKNLKKIVKNLTCGNQTQLSQRTFCEIQVESNKEIIEEYISTQRINNQIDDQNDEDDNDDVNHYEMSQLAYFNIKQDDTVIIIDDDPETIDIDEDVDYRCSQVIPSNSVLVFPQDHNSPSTSSYPDIPTNETWCRDEQPEMSLMYKTIMFPNDSLPKLTASQKLESDLFNDSMKLSSVQYLCVMSIEILFMCNDEEAFDTNSDKSWDKKFIPDPSKDPVIGIFYSVYKDICNSFQVADITGGIILNGLDISNQKFNNLTIVATEKDIFRYFTDIFKEINPDIIIGYDIERLSIGYLIRRAVILESNFLNVISRLSRTDNEKRVLLLEDMKGRISLNVWKLVRREHPMRRYNISAVVSEILNKRYAEFSQFWIEKKLRDNNPIINGVIIQHFLRFTDLDIQILIALDLFIKTSQMARVYGIQFEEVLRRGSQFRVESMLLRLAKDNGFCPPSISVEQRNAMASPETMPLTLEPRSGLYFDPVVVLDFQSLYPSVCIAYNYCFTTCLGKINEYHNLSSDNHKIQLGAMSYNLPNIKHMKELINDNMIHISPVGGIFVKKKIRRSLLSMMLEELLETRVMVKQSMKKYDDKILNRLLDARQLALKLIANVTYGYTAANFSGRMPCEEVADAIVSKGRETLEKAIKLVNDDATNGGKNYKGSKVIYGDTDSMFVLIPGLSKDEAFEIGKKIAADVTALNPYPVKLKFEKVMMPCCLLAKKRYVGMSYENETDKEGKFDAKGIETVRRDSCEYVSHVMEKVLKLLFQKNIRKAISYLRYKIEKIEKVPLKHFILSGDYREPYSESITVPMKKIAEELIEISPLHKPLQTQRLEYIVAEPPEDTSDLTVYNCVFRLPKFLEHPELKIHYTYYINRKLLPALARIFQLINIRFDIHMDNIESCKNCGMGSNIFCDYCSKNLDVLLDLMAQMRREQNSLKSCRQWCQHCTSMNSLKIRRNFPCYNVDCNVFERRIKIRQNELEEKFENHEIGRQITWIPTDKMIYK